MLVVMLEDEKVHQLACMLVEGRGKEKEEEREDLWVLN